MAGIGFELRKLLRQDDLLGYRPRLRPLGVTATGPWLLTILMLGGIVFLGSPYAAARVLAEFRLIVIYNFAFSLVIAGPVAMVATRYLADAIFIKRVEDAPSMLLGYLTLLLGVSAPIVVPFYFYWIDIDNTLATISAINFFTIAAIWLVSTFLTALKDYAAVTRAFLLGAMLALGSVALLARIASSTAHDVRVHRRAGADSLPARRARLRGVSLPGRSPPSALAATSAATGSWRSRASSTTPPSGWTSG